MTDDRIVVGRIGRPHGVKGEVTFVPDGLARDAFGVGRRFITEDGLEVSVTSSKPYRDRGLLLGFESVTTREAAERLRGSLLTIDPADRRPLDDAEFWAEDLIGLEVVDPSGAALGSVVDVELGPGQDRLVVDTGEGEPVLVPFVDDLVSDPVDGTIVVDAPEGLFG